MLGIILAALGLLWILERVKPLLSSLLPSSVWNSQDHSVDEKNIVQNRNTAIMINQKKAAFFALIIGINEYKCPEYPNLSGASPDAEAMKKYLESYLAVPPENITFLTNEKATRATIKQALYGLETNPDIKKGDTILIYYAGHGATAAAPPEWHTGGPKIQLIIPHDYKTELDGANVHGIPDRTFGVILRRIATEKGDNITVIFDCCYSGSGTRVVPEDETDSLVITPESTLKPRGIKYRLTVPEDLDQNDWGKGRRTIALPSGFIYDGLASHVHLAATSDNGIAWEDTAGGEFTSALLEKLKALKQEEISQLTYTDLIKRIGKLSNQEPRCEGKNRGRIFLDRTMPIPEAAKYGVKMEMNEYILNAGTAQGITKGSKFTIQWLQKGFVFTGAVEKVANR